MFFNTAAQPVRATEAVRDHYVALLPALVNRLEKCIHRADCITRIFQIPRDGYVGAEHIGCADLLADTFLGHGQLNSMFSSVLSSDGAAERRLSTGSRAKNHDEHPAHA